MVRTEAGLFAEQRDSKSGYDYLRTRYYDPEIGRFLSRDPAGQGNFFSYVGNNPVNLTDPTGMCEAYSYLYGEWIDCSYQFTDPNQMAYTMLLSLGLLSRGELDELVDSAAIDDNPASDDFSPLLQAALVAMTGYGLTHNSPWKIIHVPNPLKVIEDALNGLVGAAGDVFVGGAWLVQQLIIPGCFDLIGASVVTLAFAGVILSVGTVATGGLTAPLAVVVWAEVAVIATSSAGASAGLAYAAAETC